jgi:hypothetical protein
MPHWTSSKIKRRFFSSHSFLKPFKQ